jgi:signal transduction histidine kinase/HAMP domain-containing protein
MTLRQKLLLPLLILGLLMGCYIHFVWTPRLLLQAEQNYLTITTSQLDNVAESMIPPLLGNQLDIIYENLEALKQKNPGWVDVRLLSPSDRPIYPLVAAGTAAPTGENLRRIEISIKYLDMHLGTLIVLVDITPALDKLQRQNNELALLLFSLLGIMFFAVLLVLEFAVRKPLTSLTKAAQKLAAEDYDALLPVAGSDEVGSMVNSFALMRNELHKQKLELLQKHSSLQEQITVRKQAERALQDSYGLLENKVKERTADLQTANTALLAEKARQEELIKQLADAHNQLLQSEKLASVGQLAAGVAHEINNPIGFVNSNLGTLKRYITDLLRAISAYENSEGEMTEGTRAVLADLKRQIDIVYLREDVGNLLTESMDGLLRVKRIVQDLKDFSHVDEAVMQLADLEHGLDSTLNVVWNELKYKAEVIKEYGGIPKIMCIPSQLNQVFMNLLMNAVQSIEGHGRITIRTGQEGDNVWVEVEDTGKGIKPEHLDRIFDPFFTTKPVGTGTGLGLSLSYGIVQKHGGHIEVKSNPGKGTTMRVWLPAKKDDAGLPENASIVTG